MILVDINNFDQQRFYLLTHKVNMTKDSYLEVKSGETSHKSELMYGSRTQDSDRIARMIVGDIYAECKYDLEKAKSRFLSLTSTEIEPYIKKAVLESASSDYWYSYEKEW